MSEIKLIMKDISKENNIHIGYFQKPHGVFGTLQLIFENGMEEIIESASVLFVEIDGLLVPYFVAEDGIRIVSSTTAFIDIDWIDDDISAKKLCGKQVFIDGKKPAQHASDMNFTSLKGFRVLTENRIDLGIIAEINDYSGNWVLDVEKDGKIYLIPFHQDFIIEITPDNQQIMLKLPEGILDI